MCVEYSCIFMFACVFMCMEYMHGEKVGWVACCSLI